MVLPSLRLTVLSLGGDIPLHEAKTSRQAELALQRWGANVFRVENGLTVSDAVPNSWTASYGRKCLMLDTDKYKYKLLKSLARHSRVFPLDRWCLAQS